MKLKIKNKKVDYPIIQGGMGVGISLGRLAGSVALEGGMGTISMANIGYKEEDFYKNSRQANIRGFKKELEEARSISRGRGLIGVNIMVVGTQYEELARIAGEENVDYIICGAGIPLNLPELVENKDVFLAPIVSSLRALQVINKVWKKKYNRFPDFIVVEGKGAGGHLGFKMDGIETGKNLEDLTLEIVNYLRELGEDIPIFVAGSVYDGHDLRKFRELGATGIQIGTRFIGTYECDADIRFKEFVVSSNKEDLTIIKSQVGIPGRAIKNKFLHDIEKTRRPAKKCINCLQTCNPRETQFCISDALISAVKGDIDNALIFAGSNLDRVKEIVSVKSLMEKIIKEYEE